MGSADQATARNASLSEDQLRAALALCRARDPEGLRVLYAAYSEPVFRTSLRVLGSRADADDTTQEVFLRVFDKAASFEHRSAFSTWLYRLTVNLCLNRRRSLLRRMRRFVPFDEEIEPAAAERSDDAARRSESQALLERLLESLPPAQRAVLVLREIEGASYEEIAAALEIPIGTVMSRLSRARARLREVARALDAGTASERGSLLSQEIVSE